MRLDDISQRLLSTETIVDTKMPLSEGPKIYEMLKLYAKYDDLTDLYAKVVPPISTFEDKIVSFHTQLV